MLLALFVCLGGVMNQKSIFKEFTKYVSLNVIGMIGLSCYILADTFFVSKALGANGLTALNFCISVFSILQGFGLMLGIGGATRYTILRNSGEEKNANMAFVHSLALGAVLSVVFVLIGVFLSTPLVRVLGADDSTAPLAGTYLTTILCFAPFFLTNNILLAFVRNDNSPRLSMTAMLISSFSNVVLDYIFMFPMSMGMFGAAFATGLSPIISLCILSGHFTKKKNRFRLVKCRISARRIFDILFLGVSAFIGEMSSAIVLITFNLAILKIEGNIGVAAYGIVANISLIAIAVFTGVAQGIQPLASEGYGSGNKKMIKQVLRYAAFTVILLASAIYTIIYFGSGQIVAIFNSEGSEVLARLATEGIRIYFIGFFFAGINIIAAALFSATADAITAFLISILRSCVLIVPMVLIMSTLLKMEGVWLSFVLTEFIVCLISVTVLYRANRS